MTKEKTKKYIPLSVANLMELNIRHDWDWMIDIFGPRMALKSLKAEIATLQSIEIELEKERKK